MYRKYCTRVLCTGEEFLTKISKALLLFILQAGADMMSSHHFTAAMDDLRIALQQNAAFSRLAIAYKLNDRKIAKKFRRLAKKQRLLSDI